MKAAHLTCNSLQMKNIRCTPHLQANVVVGQCSWIMYLYYVLVYWSVGSEETRTSSRSNKASLHWPKDDHVCARGYHSSVTSLTSLWSRASHIIASDEYLGDAMNEVMTEMLSCISIFPQVPPDPLPPILYEYKIAIFPRTLDHIPYVKQTREFFILSQHVYPVLC